MLSVKGLFQNGVARPVEPVEGYEGKTVIITFLEEEPPKTEDSHLQEAWDEFITLVEQCAENTGISDLAHQHDHYLYGKPKQE